MKVLPGGLTRVALPRGSLVVNSSQGGGQQGYVGTARRAACGQRSRAASGANKMLSRVAENLYWISRYVERAENGGRGCWTTAYHRELDDVGLVGERAGDRVPTIAACRPAARLPAGPAPSGARSGCSDCLTFDPARGALDPDHDRPGARKRPRHRRRRYRRGVEPASISFHLYLGGPRAQRRLRSASPFRFFERVRRACVLFAALVDGTLCPRRGVSTFSSSAAQLERADMTARIVARQGSPIAGGHRRPCGSCLDSLLRVLLRPRGLLQRVSGPRSSPKASSDVSGARRPTFPRSVRFRVARCLEALREISGGGRATWAARRRNAVSAGSTATCATPTPAEVCGRGVGRLPRRRPRQLTRAGARNPAGVFPLT